MQGRQVVVTGLGVVSPLGNNRETTWKGMMEGRSGVGRISKFDPEGFACQIAGEVCDFTEPEDFDLRHIRRTDLFIRYAIGAAAEAIQDADLVANASYDPQRAGVLIGSGIGGIPMIEAMNAVLLADGPRRVSPFFIPSAIVNMASGWVSMRHDLRGPNLAVATACTTGSHAIGEGARKIAYGDAEIMVVGGTESTITPLTMAGFTAARALSTRNDEPQQASRPFDADRNGFVLSEGSGIVVLEELEHARARGVRIYCEVLGYGMSADAHHITAPPEDGRGAWQAMSCALADSGLAIEDIDHINAHGTSTPLGDKAETLAMRRLFGAHADNLAISATKSMTGHLLGAAGGLEGAVTAMAIAEQRAPPTINLDNQDPECDLDYVAGSTGRAMKIRAAISNSFGFGGTNASLVFGRT